MPSLEVVAAQSVGFLLGELDNPYVNEREIPVQIDSLWPSPSRRVSEKPLKSSAKSAHFKQLAVGKLTPNHGSISDALFTLHPETLNIWTHLITPLLWLFTLPFIVHLFITSKLTLNSFASLFVYIVSSILCFLLSSYYHFTKYSNLHSMCLPQLVLDNIGTLSYIVSSHLPGMAVISRSFPISGMFGESLVIVNMFLGASILYESSKFGLKSLLKVQKSVLVLSASWSLLFYVPYCIRESESHVGSLFLFSFVLGYTNQAIAYFVMHYRIPERWFPNRFKLIGNSHQLWHIMAAFGGYWWLFWCIWMMIIQISN
mmetsp:Transcript_3277/g.5749  ORF Transcript_3277/g.5749 Transcript_3277/m.5749 type:complete len:315 (-) Transcript_3277:790-1734(-)